MVTRMTDGHESSINSVGVNGDFMSASLLMCTFLPLYVPFGSLTPEALCTRHALLQVYLSPDPIQRGVKQHVSRKQR